MRRQQRRLMASLTTIFLLLLAPTPLGAQTPPAAPTSEQLQKIEAVIKTIMARDNIPGLSVAIVTGDQLRWSNGYGLSDVENSVPAKPATVYRLASISKTITATAAMQLFERGKLDLDAPVQKYCPAFPQKQWTLTPRQLLGHLGGVRHYHENGDDVEITRHYKSMVDALDVFKDDPLLHEPGTKFFYSSYGFNLLGCVIEGASGMKYADYVRENIFRPAGMDRIRVDDLFEIIPNRAQGYQKTAGGELRNSGLLDTSYKIPSGGLASTVEDLARFAIALQKGLLVKPETLGQAWTRQKTRDGKETPYGLGWVISEENGRKVVAHSGGQQRVSTLLYMVPERNFALVLMSNLEDAGGSMSEIAHDAKAIVFGENYDPPVIHKEIALEAKILDAYVGQYQLTPSLIVTVTNEGGRLMAQATGQPKLELFPESATDFFLKVINAQITFIKDEKGQVTGLWLRQGGQKIQATKIK